MPISFAQIPANIKIPLYWVEVDPSKAGLPTINLRALLVGTMTSDGDAEPDVPIAIGTQAQADAKFGQGSELARMFKSFFANNFANEVWGAPVAEPPIATNKKVSAAAIAVGGTGYAIGDTINLGNGVQVTVATLAASAVATVTVTNPGSAASASVPVNPVAQTGTSGSGTGATFNLTWVDDDPVAHATGTIVVTTAPTEAGTIHLYIGGQHVPVNIGGTDTAAEVAAAITEALMAHEDLPIEAVQGASPNDDTVELTCNWRGVGGNEIRIEQNYYGQIGGEVAPTGLVLTLPATGFLTGGVGTPEFDNLIINMGEQEFEYVALPFTDSTSLAAFEQEYGFSDTGRWGWMRQHFGHVFACRRGAYADLISFGQTRNSGVISVMAFEATTPTPMYEMVAAYTAKAQRALVNDPARPLQTLQLNKTLPAKLHERFNWLELNSLALNGLAIQKCWEGSGYPQIAREQTTYRLNLYGHGDDAYELVTTLATLAKLFRNQRHAITSKYPRHKLANDGTRFGPGQAIITPGIAKAELVAQYKQDEWNGLVEDTSNFKKFLLVERDPNDPNRLNVLYPPDLINQLRIFAVLGQFRLQYDRGIDVEVIGLSGLTGVAGAGGARL